MELFCNQENVGIHLAVGESSYVRLAAEDLCRDIGKVSFGAIGVIGGENPKIFIGTKDNCGSKELPLADELLEKLSCREEYIISIDENRVVILGNDYFGTMWGIYTFSKEHLGIEPTYLFSDFKPKRQRKLSLCEGVSSDYPRTYRFRGWFINDEDALTNWDRSGGRRPYLKVNHYYIMAPRVIQMVVETALRLRMNLLIPASHIDITKPNEEALVKAVTDRGLYISQHHVEPCGVIGYYFQDYWKERGRELEVSLGKYKKEYIEVWRHYVSLWSKYPHVIWQIGLRGVGDRPIWYEDPSIPDTPEAHGRVIGDAIATQYDIIKEITGDEHPITTSTLWGEGAKLFTSGDLSLPDDSNIIFADVAATQMMGGDFFAVPRRSGHGYGIYYHVQLSLIRNHMTEGTNPDKMLYNYQITAAKGDTFYSILNVSNIREFIYSISLNAAITWDVDRVTVEDFTKEFCRRVYGNEKISQLYREYYDCFFELGEKRAHDIDIDMFFFHKYDGLPFTTMPACDYNIQRIGLQAISIMNGAENEWNQSVTPAEMVMLLQSARKRFGLLLDKVMTANEALAPSARKTFETHLLMHTEFLYFEHLWAEYLVLAACSDGKERVEYTSRALEEGNKLRYVSMKRCSRGKWKNWYRGSRVKGIQRLDVYEMLEKTELLLNEMQ